MRVGDEEDQSKDCGLVPASSCRLGKELRMVLFTVNTWSGEDQREKDKKERPM
jgi:hypothetical protein